MPVMKKTVAGCHCDHLDLYLATNPKESVSNDRVTSAYAYEKGDVVKDRYDENGKPYRPSRGIQINAWDEKQELLSNFVKGDFVSISGVRSFHENQGKTYESITIEDIILIRKGN